MLKEFDVVSIHLEGEVYKVIFSFVYRLDWQKIRLKDEFYRLQNTTINFEDIETELTLKINLDFQQFPENYLFSATPSTPTFLTLVFRFIQLFFWKGFETEAENDIRIIIFLQSPYNIIFRRIPSSIKFLPIFYELLLSY